MKQKWFLLALSIMLLGFGQAFSMDFRADITGPGAVNDGGVLKILPNTLCSLNVYSTNNDNIFDPPYQNRVTWSSAFAFTGNVTVQWQDVLASDNTLYSDAPTLAKFTTTQFAGYWDVIKGVYAETRDGNLPDRFNFSGIANSLGYPPGLGELKILWWAFQTANTSGQLCIEQGDFQNDTYDWLFDDPSPTFNTVCFPIKETSNQAPVLAPIGAKSVDEGVNLNFGVSATDGDGNPLTLTASPLPTGATFTDHADGTGTFDWTPGFTQSGSYPVTFIASDNSLADTEIVTITVNNVNRAPVLVAIGPKSVNEGVNLNFGTSASDPDGTVPTLTASPLPTGATYTDHGNGTGTFDWTPDFTQANDYNIVFRASDGSLLDTEIVVITVNNANQPPILAAIGPKSVNENVNLNFGVSATDGDGSTPILTTSTLPSGALFTDNGNGTGTFDWTPDYTQAGIDTVVFRATDGLLTDTEIVVITVNNVDRPPVLNQIAAGPVNVNEGATLVLNITATDPDIGTIPSITSTATPPNAVLVDNGDGSAVFTFNPDFSQAGIYPISFYASDGTLWDTELVVIEVIDVPVEQPCLSINPDSLIFIIEWCNPLNSPIDTIDFKIINCGTGTLNWAFDSVPNFINVPKMSGSGNDSFQITFNYDSVPPADTLLLHQGDTIVYSGIAALAAPGALNSPKMIPVKAFIYCAPPPPQPCLAVYPDSLVFKIDWCKPYLSLDTLFMIIYNCGTGTLDWTIDSLPSFTSAYPLSGSGGGDSLVQVRFEYGSVHPDTNLLYQGDTIHYSGLLSVSAPGATNPHKFVTVRADVYCQLEPPAPMIAATPSSFDFVVDAGSGTINTGLLVSEVHYDSLLFWCYNSQPWLVLDTMPFTPLYTPDSIRMLINIDTLPAGTYCDTIFIYSYTPSESLLTLEVPVCITINPVIPPGSDSVWISTVPATPGSDIMVPVYFRNAEILSSLRLPLKWNSSLINLDSVTFDGTRVDYVDVKPVTIDNTSHQAHIFVMPTLTPEIPVGRGMLAKLHFSVDNSAGSAFVKIDTVRNTPDSLMFEKTDMNGLVPIFICGGVVIDTVPGYICGRVIDNEGNEIEGATVELWDDFPGGSMFYSAMSDIGGQFACNSFEIFPFDAYAYKEGYYPGKIEDVQYGDIGFDIVLTPVPPVPPTNEWVNFYCDFNEFYNVPLPAGSVVDAYDPDGVHCGTFYVTTPGSYGFMPVYRDDPYTEIDDGADPGDSITFFVNGYAAITSGDVVWTENGDSHEVCLSVFPSATRCITLHEGWNLISWNVDTPDDYITTLLNPVMECVEVVLGYEQGGFTYDPDLPDFSTLWSMDHFHGYWVKMNCEMELCVTGAPVSATTPIELEKGWNLVSYLPNETDSTQHALNSIMEGLIVALGYDGGALTYDPELPGYSTLKTMGPGFGYWVKVTDAGQLIYPGIGPMVVKPQIIAGADKAVAKNRVQSSSMWVNLYSHQLMLDDQAVPAGTEILAVASDGSVIGAGTIRSDGKFGFMPVYGDDPSTPDHEGIAPGTKFSLVVDGKVTAETFTWTENGARIEVKSLVSKGGATVIPSDYSLLQNYPNPFNPTTSISFAMPTAAPATLEIYNVLGEKVITLFNGMANAGTNTVDWQGVDASGQPVASGIYFYRLKTAAFEQTRKMVMMK